MLTGWITVFFTFLLYAVVVQSKEIRIMKLNTINYFSKFLKEDLRCPICGVLLAEGDEIKKSSRLYYHYECYRKTLNSFVPFDFFPQVAATKVKRQHGEQVKY